MASQREAALATAPQVEIAAAMKKQCAGRGFTSAELSAMNHSFDKYAATLRALGHPAHINAQEFIDTCDRDDFSPWRGRNTGSAKLDGAAMPAERPARRAGGMEVLSRTDSVVDRWAPDHRDGPLSLGHCALGIVTGDWSGREAEHLSLQGSSQTSGGYLLNDAMSGFVIDAARAQSVCVRAGAGTIAMPTGSMKFPKTVADPTAYWRAETAPITESQPVFAGFLANAKTLAVLVPISVELAEDNSNAAADAIERSIISALSLKLDYAALRGVGAGHEPQGITNLANINTVAVGGGLTFDSVSQGVEEIVIDNHMPTSVVWHPSIAGDMDRRKSGDGKYEPGSAWYEMLGKYMTTQMPTDTVIVGDFSKLNFLMRTGIVLESFRSGSTATIDAVSEMMILIRAYLRADVLVTHDEAFCTLTGITT